MKLNDNYFIKYDETNVILVFAEERLNKKDELTTYTEDYYYPTVETALKAFLQKSIKGSESVDEILKRIEDVEQLIKSVSTKQIK